MIVLKKFSCKNQWKINQMYPVPLFVLFIYFNIYLFIYLFSEVYTAEFILTGVMRQEKNFNQFQIEVQ